MQHTRPTKYRGQFRHRLLPIGVVYVAVLLLLQPVYGDAQNPTHSARISHLAPKDVTGRGWVAGFAKPGIEGGIYALAAGPQGSVFGGGRFRQVDGTSFNTVARWDGVTWQPLDGSPSGAVASVHALALGPDGSVYAGGSFTSAGGVSARNVARWDGVTWHPLGAGIGGQVLALAIGPDRSLYAAGYPQPASGFHGIARWDGTTWQSLGEGINGPGGGEPPHVKAMAVGSDGSIFVGGSFNMAGAVSANNIARWIPATASWQPLGSGTNRRVKALAIGLDGAVYVGGSFSTAGTAAANRIARWDPVATGWQPLGAGLEGGGFGPYASALSIASDGSLYVSGDFAMAGGGTASNVARWDPVTSSWSGLLAGTDKEVFASVITPDQDLYVSGDFHLAGSLSANGIARWALGTSSWHALGAGVSGGIAREFALGNDGSLYAGGSFSHAGGVLVNHIARWSPFDLTWHVLGTGTNGQVEAIAVDANGKLCAGGRFSTAGDVAADRLACWDGVTWNPVGNGVSGGGALGPAVFDLAFAPDGSLVVGGSFDSAGGLPVGGIARWDPAASSWDDLQGGTNGFVSVMAVGPDGFLYVGGGFTAAGGVAANNIARWDGVGWHPLGTGLERSDGALPSPESMAFDSRGDLYVGGFFTIAGGFDAPFVARWEPATSSWHPLGSGTDGQVHTLATDPDGSVYAGGWFTTAGGIPANYVARWNPATATWQPMGSGVSSGSGVPVVFSMLAHPDGVLYVGGAFRVAGGIPSMGVAQWRGYWQVHMPLALRS